MIFCYPKYLTARFHCQTKASNKMALIKETLGVILFQRLFFSFAPPKDYLPTAKFLQKYRQLLHLSSSRDAKTLQTFQSGRRFCPSKMNGFLAKTKVLFFALFSVLKIYQE